MSDDFGSIPGARISLFKATLRAISVWRISPNRSCRPIEMIGFSHEKGRGQIAEVAATSATILSVRKPQRQPFLSVSTVNELHRSDVECAMFSVRMNICEAQEPPSPPWLGSCIDSRQTDRNHPNLFTRSAFSLIISW